MPDAVGFPWRLFRELRTGALIRARWVPGHHMEGGGTWGVEGGTGCVDPLQAAEEWEAADAA